MKIGFIGAGKVGTAFGIYLKENGTNIYGYCSRTYKHAQLSAKLTESEAKRDISQIIIHSDIIFITTNDDQILNVCNNLLQGNDYYENKIIGHMSGALSSQILEPLKNRGCSIFSLHPLQSFASIEKSLHDLKNTVFSIEGDKDRIYLIEDILKKTGNKCFKLTKEQKNIYHAGASVISNYMVTLIDYGLTLFETIGIEKEKSFKAIYPLIQGTIENISIFGTEKALTGPVARGDIETIKKHIEALKSINPDLLEMYKIMGLKTVELATKEKLNEKNKVLDLIKLFEGV